MQNTKNIRCDCGKYFATVKAMEQHAGASRRHVQARPQEAVQNLSITQQENKDSRRISVLHSVSLTRGNYHEDKNSYDVRSLQSTKNPFPNNTPQPYTLGLRNNPIVFVRAGENLPAKSQRKRKGRQQKRENLYYTRQYIDPYRDNVSDIGDNHALCDKSCGWCGNCADNVDY